MSPYERSPKVDPESNEKLSSDRTSKKIGSKVLRIRNLIIGAGVAAVIVGGGLYMNSLSNSGDANKNPEQSQSQAANQEKKERNLQEIIAEYDNKQPSAEEITEQFKIPTGLDDTELADEFISKLNGWINFGSDPLLRAEYMHSQTNINEFEDRTDSIAAKNAKIIAPMLLENDDYDLMNKFIEQMQDRNSKALHLSNSPDSPDTAPPQDALSRSFKFTRVKNTTPPSFTDYGRVLDIYFEDKKGDTVIYDGIFKITFEEVDGRTVGTGFIEYK